MQEAEYSKVTAWRTYLDTLTFGPTSVLPKHHRDDVGSALIRKSLEAASELGYRAMLIFGHENYYPRFGFKSALEYGITTADGKNFPAFMALPLYGDALDDVHGKLICTCPCTEPSPVVSDANSQFEHRSNVIVLS